MTELTCPHCGGAVELSLAMAGGVTDWPERSTRLEREWTSGDRRNLPVDQGPQDVVQEQIRAFFYDELRLDPNAELRTDDLLARYGIWCKRIGLAPLSPQMVGRRLRTLGIEQRRANGRRFYVGVDFL